LRVVTWLTCGFDLLKLSFGFIELLKTLPVSILRLCQLCVNLLKLTVAAGFELFLPGCQLGNYLVVISAGLFVELLVFQVSSEGFLLLINQFCFVSGQQILDMKLMGLFHIFEACQCLGVGKLQLLVTNLQVFQECGVVSVDVVTTSVRSG
jgi:hypothetical protein